MLQGLCYYAYFEPLSSCNPLGDASDLTFGSFPHTLSLSPAFLRFVVRRQQIVVRGPSQFP